jgi:hypothetical protein
MNEHGREPVRGLPAPLPEGERILWQGAPDARAILMGALRLPWAAGYFALLFAWTIVAGLGDGAGAAVIATRLGAVAAAGAGVAALLGLYAWAVARTTVYTITNKRVVIRHGVALQKAFNVPFRVVTSAGLKLDRAGTGDLPLALSDGQRIAFVHLWPHVRPWRFTQTEPMLRGVPKAAEVAVVLAEALRAAHPLPAEVAASVASTPVRPARRPRRAAAGRTAPA